MERVGAVSPRERSRGGHRTGVRSRFAFPQGRVGAYDVSDVYVMNADGTHARRLARDVREPRWSPDGTQIAFTLDSGQGRDVYIVNASGGRERRLTHTGNSTIGGWASGREIIFTRGGYG